MFATILLFRHCYKMMRNTASLFFVLILSACGASDTGSPREVSRADTPMPQGLTYEQFRGHSFNNNADMGVVQKRFILLDRDHNGVLSENEFSGD